MPSLDRLISSSRRAVEERRGSRPLPELEEAVRHLDSIRPFTEGVVGEEISFVLRIAEADPGLLAEAQEAGAAGLAIARDAVPPGLESTRLPVLHKGVLIDPYQLYESRLAGADGIVLIAAAFDGSDDDFVRMYSVAGELGLDVVVEVAEEEEIELALDILDPDSFLVQNHLEDRGFDLERTFSLLEEVPAGKAVLSEGGIQTRDQVLALERAGVDAAILGDWIHELGVRETFEILRGDSRE
jgi:indole-3-glycerol phosphate synthase